MLCPHCGFNNTDETAELCINCRKKLKGRPSARDGEAPLGTSGRGFSPKEAISSGWEKMKENIGIFIPLVLLSLIATVIDRFVIKETRAVTLSIDWLSWLVDIIVYIAAIGVSLRTYSNEKASISDMFSALDRFWDYLLGHILYGLIVLGGLILLIIPGIIWSVKFIFTPFLIIDKKMNAPDALRESARITEGYKWQLFILGLLLILINIAGALCLGIGLFATIPTTWLAMTFVYRKLTAE